MIVLDSKMTFVSRTESGANIHEGETNCGSCYKDRATGSGGQVAGGVSSLLCLSCRLLNDLFRDRLALAVVVARYFYGCPWELEERRR